MATVNLFLDQRPDTDGRKRVYLQLNHAGKKKTFFISEVKLLPDQWNAKMQHIRPKALVPDTYRHTLDFYRNKLSLVVREAINEHGKKADISILWEGFIKQVRFREPAAQRKNAHTLIELIEEVVAQKKEHIKATTLVNYTNAIASISACEKYHKRSYSLDNLHTFYAQYKFFLLHVEGKANTTFNAYLGTIKTALTFLSSSGYFERAQIMFKESWVNFKWLKEYYHTAYFKQQDLEAIAGSYFVRPSKSGKYVPWTALNKARDFVLFLCYCGIRSSDYKKIKKERLLALKNAKGETYHVLRFMQEKTNDMLQVPLNNVCMEILERYEYAPPKYSQKFMNKYVRLVAKHAGINEQIEVISLQDNLQVPKMVPRYETFTVHSCRHSFAMYLLKKNVAIKVIQQLLGHRSVSTTLKYLHMMEQEEVHSQALEALNF